MFPYPQSGGTLPSSMSHSGGFVRFGKGCDGFLVIFLELVTALLSITFSALTRKNDKGQAIVCGVGRKTDVLTRIRSLVYHTGVGQNQLSLTCLH